MYVDVQVTAPRQRIEKPANHKSLIRSPRQRLRGSSNAPPTTSSSSSRHHSPLSTPSPATHPHTFAAMFSTTRQASAMALRGMLSPRATPPPPRPGDWQLHSETDRRPPALPPRQCRLHFLLERKARCACHSEARPGVWRTGYATPNEGYYWKAAPRSAIA